MSRFFEETGNRKLQNIVKSANILLDFVCILIYFSVLSFSRYEPDCEL